MQSKHLHLKPKARALRTQGLSIVHIEKSLGIPRSTLSGWFKDIILTDQQIDTLDKQKMQALLHARVLAKNTHIKNKNSRIAKAEQEATKQIYTLDLDDASIQELCLSMLYLGEGTKSHCDTGMGNSDPRILKFFIHVLLHTYALSVTDITCYLHLRADQDVQAMTKYWSSTLYIPTSQFRKPLIDKRTLNSPTRKGYHGVCYIRCGNVAIQRKLIYLSTVYIDQVLKRHSGD